MEWRENRILFSISPIKILENKGLLESQGFLSLCGALGTDWNLTRKRSYPNFAWHQIDLLKCWVRHKVGSRGAAQPRKVGQPKPSISSAAQLQSKKERKKERQGKREQRKPQRGRKRNQRPMSPFCLSTKVKINTCWQHSTWPQNYCDQKDSD